MILIIMIFIILFLRWYNIKLNGCDINSLTFFYCWTYTWFIVFIYVSCATLNTFLWTYIFPLFWMVTFWYIIHNKTNLLKAYDIITTLCINSKSLLEFTMSKATNRNANFYIPWGPVGHVASVWLYLYFLSIHISAHLKGKNVVSLLFCFFVNLIDVYGLSTSFQNYS